MTTGLQSGVAVMFPVSGIKASRVNDTFSLLS